MMYIKMMSDEDMPDMDSRKGFVLLTLGDKDSFHFGKSTTDSDLSDKDHNTLHIVRDGSYDFESYELHGNVYIMNANGKTIQTCAMR